MFDRYDAAEERQPLIPAPLREIVIESRGQRTTRIPIREQPYHELTEFISMLNQEKRATKWRIAIAYLFALTFFTTFCIFTLKGLIKHWNSDDNAEDLYALTAPFFLFGTLILIAAAPLSIASEIEFSDLGEEVQNKVTAMMGKYGIKLELGISKDLPISDVIQMLETQKRKFLDDISMKAFIEFASDPSSVPYSFFKGRPMGCMLYRMSSLPAFEQLENYKNCYILIHTNKTDHVKLFFVNPLAVADKDMIIAVNIEDKMKFITMFNRINKKNDSKLYLTHAQAGELITKNGGHMRVISNINRLPTEIKHLISQNYQNAITK